MTKQAVSHHSTTYMTTIHNRLAGVQTVQAATDVAMSQYLFTTIALYQQQAAYDF